MMVYGQVTWPNGKSHSLCSRWTLSDNDEPVSFAQSVAATFTDAGLKVRVNSLAEICQFNQKDTVLKTPDTELAKVLDALIKDATGKPTVTLTFDAYGKPNDTVLIINHK